MGRNSSWKRPRGGRGQRHPRRQAGVGPNSAPPEGGRGPAALPDETRQLPGSFWCCGRGRTRSYCTKLCRAPARCLPSEFANANYGVGACVVRFSRTSLLLFRLFPTLPHPLGTLSHGCPACTLLKMSRQRGQGLAFQAGLSLAILPHHIHTTFNRFPLRPSRQPP